MSLDPDNKKDLLLLCLLKCKSKQNGPKCFGKQNYFLLFLRVNPAGIRAGRKKNARWAIWLLR